ncbi:Uncharacterized protein PBTT_10317 [Plasmodiophora brassicae]
MQGGGGGGGGGPPPGPPFPQIEAALRPVTKTVQFFGGMLTGKSGAPVPASITVGGEYVPQCDVAGVKAFQNVFSHAQALTAQLLSNPSASSDLSFLQYAIGARDTVQSCRKIINSFFATTQKKVTIPGANYCAFEYGSSQFATSPCCNQSLANSQCCVPATVQASVTTLNNVSLPTIQAQCATPGKVQLAILGYMASYNQISQKPLDYNALFNSWFAFTGQCQSLIYNQQCTKDSDCVYSGSCDTTNSKTCKVPWGTDYLLVLQCYYDRMAPDLKTTLNVAWRLDPSNAATYKQAFIGMLNSTLVTEDCFGQGDSYQWHSQYNNGCMRPGNKTGCLLKKNCNYDFSVTSQAQCLGTTPVDKSSSFCGQCSSPTNCWKQSQPSYCQATFYQTQQACTARNLTWYNPWSQCANCQGFCVDTNKTTQATCTPPSICGTQNPWACGSMMCVATNVTQQACQNAWQTRKTFSGDSNSYQLYWMNWMNDGKGLCGFNQQWGSQVPLTQAFCSSFAPAVGNATIRLFEGYNWNAGQYNTPESCAAGQCNWQDPQGLEWGGNLSPQQCVQKQFCTMPCPRCFAQRTNGAGNNVCYVPGNAFNQTACLSLNGQWQSSVVGGNARCLIGDGSVTQPACLSTGTKYNVKVAWASCSQLPTNDTTCSATGALGEIAPYLNCQFQPWAPCPDKASCQAIAGQCNDWDRQQWNNGRQSFGTCYLKIPPDVNGNVQCQSRKSPANPSTMLNWGSLPGTCSDPSLTNGTQCARYGGLWRDKAFTKAACLADQACHPQGNEWTNNMDAANCAACNSVMGPIYRWSPGQWVNASMVPFQWKAKQWVNANMWGLQVANQNMQTLFMAAASVLQAQQSYNQLVGTYGFLSNFFDQVACDCTPGGAARNCFGTLPPPVPQAQLVLAPGMTSQTQSTGCKLIVSVASSNATSKHRRRLLAAGGGNTVQVTVGVTTAASLAVMVNGVASYAVVRASSTNGAVVGQLLGDGSAISGLAQVSSATITLNFNVLINRTSAYTVAWIGALVNNAFVVPVTGIAVNASSGSVTTVDLKADGTYFPVLLAANWQQQASLVVTTIKKPKMTTTRAPTPAGPTPAPTPAGPTPAPTPASTPGEGVLKVSPAATPAAPGLFLQLVVVAALACFAWA